MKEEQKQIIEVKKNRKDLYVSGKCGQGYEDDRCVNCKWCMGIPIGLLACGKGMMDSKGGLMMLGKK